MPLEARWYLPLLIEQDLRSKKQIVQNPEVLTLQVLQADCLQCNSLPASLSGTS
jgi:hypothetical protein